MDNEDHPHVLVFPPLLLSVFIGLAIASSFLFPVPIFSNLLAARFMAIALVVISAALGLWAKREMGRAQTNVNPRKPTLSIVKSGPFRYVRNPLYMVLIWILVATAFGLNNLGALALAVPFTAILHFGVILREERYLEAKFGEEYREYKRRVRRW